MRESVTAAAEARDAMRRLTRRLHDRFGGALQRREARRETHGASEAVAEEAEHRGLSKFSWVGGRSHRSAPV